MFQIRNAMSFSFPIVINSGDWADGTASVFRAERLGQLIPRRNGSWQRVVFSCTHPWGVWWWTLAINLCTLMLRVVCTWCSISRDIIYSLTGRKTTHKTQVRHGMSLEQEQLSNHGTRVLTWNVAHSRWCLEWQGTASLFDECESMVSERVQSKLCNWNHGSRVLKSVPRVCKT